MALGAQRSNVLALILAETTAAVLAGIGLGVVGVAFSAKLLAHFLYEVTAADWVAFTGAIAILSGTTIVAVSVPAVRALRVDPVKTMRVS
jgi:ABC-type antimicrobial peptide transport system permease subunit